MYRLIFIIFFPCMVSFCYSTDVCKQRVKNFCDYFRTQDLHQEFAATCERLENLIGNKL